MCLVWDVAIRRPAISINDQIYCNVQGERTAAVVKDLLSGGALPEPSARPPPDAGDFRSLQRLVELFGRAAVCGNPRLGWHCRHPESRGLRGMGGAGFPTGTKWEIVSNAAGKEKYIVCNADESEPGTIKDRFIMENVPYLLIEGMITAGLVTGAKQGILYIRHEYERPREILQEEIEKCYRAEVAGAEHPGQ